MPGARYWRQQLTLAAGDRQAGVQVLEAAAILLEQGQPSAPP
jgi:hypothetical protein